MMLCFLFQSILSNSAREELINNGMIKTNKTITTYLELHSSILIKE